MPRAFFLFQLKDNIRSALFLARFENGLNRSVRMFIEAADVFVEFFIIKYLSLFKLDLSFNKLCLEILSSFDDHLADTSFCYTKFDSIVRYLLCRQIGQAGNISFAAIERGQLIRYLIELSDGQLRAGWIQIGTEGKGRFVHSGGTVEVAGNLILGAEPGEEEYPGEGTYELSDGQLSAASMVIGAEGCGAFTQTGGKVRTEHLLVGPEGHCRVDGGVTCVGQEPAYQPPPGSLHVGLGGEVSLASGALVEVAGDYQQTANGRLTVEIGPQNVLNPDVCPIQVNGMAKLDGTLAVQRAEGFVPEVGSRFNVMSYESIEGRFSTFEGSEIDDERFFGLNYRQNSLEVITLHTPQAIPGSNGQTLVLITHGWNGRAGQNATFPWVCDLAEAIRDNSRSDVQVMVFGWTNYAGESGNFLEVPGVVQLACEIGESLGNWLVETGNVEGKTTVHLLSHSAGSWLVDAVADVIDREYEGVQIHLTLLDAAVLPWPWAPHRYGDTAAPVLGESADWAEQYVNCDDFWFTNELLPGAFNIEVTDLRPEGQDGHSWPRVWYQQTVADPDNRQLTGGERWGFVLASEYSLSALPSHYVYRRNNYVKLLPVEAARQTVNFSDTPNVTSDTGTVTFQPDGSGFEMATGSPVWLTSLVGLDEQANFMRFDFAFPADDSGLLTVWVNCDEVYRVEEAHVPDDSVYSTGFFWLGQTLDVGTHTLLFRLDSAEGEQSAVGISNVEFALGEPIPDSASLLWTGAIDNTWDIGRTANWLHGITPHEYHDGDLVLFDDTAEGASLVDIEDTVSPGLVVVVNDAVDFGLSGSGSIGGAGGLIKDGNGTLTIATTNTYTGETYVNAGTVVVASEGALGAGVVKLGDTMGSDSASVLVDGPFTVDCDITVQDDGDAASTRTLGGTGASGTAVFSGDLTLGKDLLLTAEPGGEVRFEGAIANPDGHTLIKVGEGTVVFEGFQTHGPGSLLEVQDGLLILNTDASGTGLMDDAHLSISVTGAELHFGCNQHLDTLTIGDGGLVRFTGANVVVLKHLVMNGIDLGGVTLTPEPATLLLLGAGLALAIARKHSGPRR